MRSAIVELNKLLGLSKNVVHRKHRSTMKINGRLIGADAPVYIIAEMSCNHHQSLDNALAIVRAAADCGCDAIKLQTYTPDTITMDCSNEHFTLKDSLWSGRNYYSLYQEAFTPWEWHREIFQEAQRLGLDYFSSPFDDTAVDFLESLDVPCYKVASFECTCIPLLRKIGSTGKPVIMSTGMASLGEIEEAIQTLYDAGTSELCLLKCTSAYPCPASESNLRTIPSLRELFGVPVGLSDHSLESCIPVAAVALGAALIEKHITLSREREGPDSQFSTNPEEFKLLVDQVRTVESALGRVCYGSNGPAEDANRQSRRSLFVSADVKEGEVLDERNIRWIRPAAGLHTRYYEEVIGRVATRAIERGTPLSWDMVSGPTT